jgi:hypothetical protein
MSILFDKQVGALNMVRLADEEEEANGNKVSESFLSFIAHTSTN